MFSSINSSISCMSSILSFQKKLILGVCGLTQIQQGNFENSEKYVHLFLYDYSVHVFLKIPGNILEE